MDSVGCNDGWECTFPNHQPINPSAHSHGAMGAPAIYTQDDNFKAQIVDATHGNLTVLTLRGIKHSVAARGHGVSGVNRSN